MTEPAIQGLDFLAFFERTPDLVCIVSKEGRFVQINPSVVGTLGYPAHELIGQVVAQYIHPDDRELTRLRRSKLLTGQALLNFQNRYIARDGHTVWLDWTSVYLPDKEVVFAIAKNVTERKVAEKEVEAKYDRIRYMADHFKTTLEADRMALASELHEDLAQLASVIKMDIEWVKQSLPDIADSTLKRMQNAEMVADLLINTIRRMTFSISPGMLNDLGIVAALDWHCQEFTRLTGIPCSFKSDCSEDELTQEIKVDFFRICQESLNNVLYHAKAATVRVHLHQNNNEIRMSVTDDGIGFEVQKAAKLSGLIKIRERASSINGEVQVISEPGLGTTVLFSVRN
ncbi:MAG: PAS domain S-box protein [Chitinophagaceae bacterium]|nr:MAG: PAS domain S-box protein [Chitinophagaceae bacterium]